MSNDNSQQQQRQRRQRCDADVAERPPTHTHTRPRQIDGMMKANERSEPFADTRFRPSWCCAVVGRRSPRPARRAQPSPAVEIASQRRHNTKTWRSVREHHSQPTEVARLRPWRVPRARGSVRPLESRVDKLSDGVTPKIRSGTYTSLSYRCG